MLDSRLGKLQPNKSRKYLSSFLTKINNVFLVEQT